MNSLSKNLILLFVLFAFAQGVWAQTYITVSNETELRNAITDGANILFTQDIPITSVLEITGNKTVTLDLGGYTLDRGLTAQASYGQVITVRNGSTLNLSNGTLTGSYGGDGGGIHNEGTSNLTNVIITGNTAQDRGGGISNSGTLTMTDCTLSGNTSRDNMDNIGGGGLFNHPNCTATLTNVTLAGNNAFYGGGLCNRGALTMEGCTISDNLAFLYGGGIRNEGTLTLTDCAVVNNIADNSNPLFSKSGSGVWNNATLNIQGNVQIKDNNDDDIYLPTGSKITVTDALTGGPGSIGVRMQIPGVFTSGYQSHNSETDHFFSNIVPNDIVLVNGEAKMRYGYYECSWDGDSRQLVHTVKHIPDNAQIVNVCDINNGGVLWGNDYWFIAEGTNSTVNGLTCNGSDIHFILCDDAQYTVNEGLFVNEGTTLHVYCQSYGDRMGKLICIGDDSQPGIGPKYDDNGTTHYSGNIDIHGGDIRATGGDNAAGIGGCEDRSSGTITIWDGKIRATGGDYGAGIGGGEDGSGTNTYIYGGDVKATAGVRAAGIGGGERCSFLSPGGGDSGQIEIYGGAVEATGGDGFEEDDGAGIGSGCKGINAGPITIWGGKVIANGCDFSAGIGGGAYTMGANVVINGGIVKAQGGLCGAGIGGGISEYEAGTMTLPYGYPNTIVINDGIVMASSKPINYHQSPSEAAGIGGGYSGPGGDITINGGIVVAYSEDGAGIGSGRLGYVPRVEINGGSVVALAMLGGAGIGGGRQGETGYVFINGGEVMAIGGAHEFISDAIYDPLTSLNVSSFIVDLIGRFLLSLRGGAYIDPTNTIYTVFQEIAEIIILLNQVDTWGGAGIGGGNSDKGSWSIEIKGGYVVARGGHEGANAIGKGYNGESSVMLDFIDGIMVSAGSNPNNYAPVSVANRVSACRDNLFVYTMPCGHKDAEEYQDNGDGTYTTFNSAGCNYCGIGGYQTLPHIFSDDGPWNVADNWSSGHVPMAGNDVLICAHCEIPADYVAKAETIGLPYYDTIFIKEGGQLFHSNLGVMASTERTIPTYSSTNGHYYLIASPMATSIAPNDTIITNLLANDHDLYKFDQSETLEWRNYKAQPEDFSIDNGIGYLYANNGNGESNYTVIFMGELQPSKEDVSITPFYDPNAEFKGWNLVGNPFACDAYLNDASDESMAFYRMNDDGDGFIAATGAIHQLEGIFVQATAPGQSFNFSRMQEESSKGGSLFLDLYRANTRNANVVDNAIVRFGSANTLEKFYFNDRNAKLYIPQDDKDYAVVHAYKTGELPLNFKVTEDGIYTLGFNLEGIDFNYLHLIDNLTGADVDLLSQTHEDIIADSDSQSLSYTFTAKSTDYESRFRLVFSVNNEE